MFALIMGSSGAVVLYATTSSIAAAIAALAVGGGISAVFGRLKYLEDRALEEAENNGEQVKNDDELDR